LINDIVSLLETEEIPHFKNHILEVESYKLRGEFELELEIEGSGSYHTSVNRYSLDLRETEKLLRFINRSIEEFKKLQAPTKKPVNPLYFLEGNRLSVL